VLPLSVLGIGFSSYHYLIQLGVIEHSGACKVGIPCGLRYVNYAGFITIPLLALTAFSLITIVMALMAWNRREPAG
jgi:disulfide bond formation protein DsbB